MTDAHDPRLDAARELVISKCAVDRGFNIALDALIDAAIALGAEPMVAALRAGIATHGEKCVAGRSCKFVMMAEAALATGKESDHDWHIHTGERPGHYADGHTHLAATGKEVTDAAG